MLRARRPGSRLLTAFAAVVLGRLTVALAALAASAAAAAVTAGALASHGSPRPHLAGPKKKAPDSGTCTRVTRVPSEQTWVILGPGPGRNSPWARATSQGQVQVS